MVLVSHKYIYVNLNISCLPTIWLDISRADPLGMKEFKISRCEGWLGWLGSDGGCGIGCTLMRSRESLIWG